MRTIRYPAPLHPGDTIGVTSPSSGLAPALMPRFEFCRKTVAARGFKTRFGAMLEATGVVSGTIEARAAEFNQMMTDPSLRAVVPPWGGELAIDLLDKIDWERIARAEPVWLVGYSDLTTLMLPLTLRTGLATLHGSCYVETAFEVDPPLIPWHLAAAALPGSAITQGASKLTWAEWLDYREHPTLTRRPYKQPTRWTIAGREDDPSARVVARGRLIGGCIDVIGHLVGTAYGDVPRFGHDCAEDGLLVYLENCELSPMALERYLRQMVYAGWFTHANAILIGRSSAPAANSEAHETLHGYRYTQRDAILAALGPLGIPVICDMDIGHIPPQMMLINGAYATVVAQNGGGMLEQVLR
jgi:muramoyltetrapeptide carboxypeptidase